MGLAVMNLRESTPPARLPLISAGASTAIHVRPRGRLNKYTGRDDGNHAG